MRVSFKSMKSVAFPVVLSIIAAVFSVALAISFVFIGLAAPVEAMGNYYNNYNNYNPQLYWCGTYYSYSPCASYNYSYQNYSPYYNSYPNTYAYPKQQM